MPFDFFTNHFKNHAFNSQKYRVTEVRSKILTPLETTRGNSFSEKARKSAPLVNINST